MVGPAVGRSSWKVDALEVSASVDPGVPGATCVVAEVRNCGEHPIPLPEVGVRVAASPEAVLEHGWQSWSVVRRCPPGDHRPERAGAERWLRAMLLADGEATGRAVVGEQFLLFDGGLVGFADGRRHFGVVRVGEGVLDAVALFDGVELAPGASRELEPIWLSAGAPGPEYDAFVEHWGRQANGRVNAPAPKGWCSWYQFFHRVTPGEVHRAIPILAARGFEVVQLDDGYQAAVGDWLEERAGWEGEVQRIADAVRAAGMRAGIWTAPFLAGEGSMVVAKHPEWLVRDEDGEPQRAMWNPVAWGGWAYALDTTNPEVLAHLEQTYAALVAMGFDYHKIDFCYSAAVPGVRADRSLTRAEALRRGLEAVRRGIGEEAFLLGCGCPFGPAVGVVDAMRVSADVAPYWSPPEAAPGFFEHPPAAVNAISASVLRAPMHRRLWINDPDCLMVRSFDTELDSGARGVLAAVVAGAGGFTVLSDDVARLGEEEWSVVDQVASSPNRDTLSLPDPFAPVLVVQGHHQELLVDWEGSTEPPTGAFAEASLKGQSSNGAWALLRRRDAGAGSSPT